jgi:mono/diheme cytochrome c family protein
LETQKCWRYTPPDANLPSTNLNAGSAQLLDRGAVTVELIRMTTTQWLQASILLSVVVAGHAGAADMSGAQLYQTACAACHGAAGRGQPQTQVAFDVPLPDFTDCSFSTREPDEDWLAIIHSGGPTRAFDAMMPAFGEALSQADMQQILAHLRTFCSNREWPRGELNLPRALLTEKAYPEDEAVITSTISAEGPSSVTAELLWEQRFGPRSQLELSVPFSVLDTEGSEGREAGIGDIAVGIKHALYHNLEAGSIFSIGAEVIIPTGDESRGLGAGTTVLEPFILFGQLLPAGAFLQLHALGEFPAESGFEDEVGWRAAIGKTWTSGRFGRAWTPMLEIVGGRELRGGAKTNWDLVPQLQVTLATRQHVMANLGVRLPVTETSTRDTQIMLYVLWDWYDGGLFEGW